MQEWLRHIPVQTGAEALPEPEHLAETRAAPSEGQYVRGAADDQVTGEGQVGNLPLHDMMAYWGHNPRAQVTHVVRTRLSSTPAGMLD